MFDLLTSPLFYLFLTIAVYFLFALLVKKTKLVIFNPLLWTIIFMVGYLLLITLWGHGNIENENIGIEVTKYENAAYMFDIMLSPVTVALALPLYLNRHVIKENWIAVLVATIVGVGSSLLTVYLLSLALNLNRDIMFAAFPRGVTTAIAKDIASILGASEQTALTVTIVALTGIVGATLGPLLIRLFGDKDDTIVGLSLGSSSHIIGTSKAFDYSEKAGSIATVSVITNGLLTVIISLIISLAI